MDSRNHFKLLKCGLQPIYAQDLIVQNEDVDASCLKCQRNVEHRKLCLKGQTICLLPIECASEFDTLCLREWKNLESANKHLGVQIPEIFFFFFFLLFTITVLSKNLGEYGKLKAS